MAKIRLGGLKLLEGGAQVILSSPCEDSLLATKICAPLAAKKINLTLLAHVFADGGRVCSTTLCVEKAAGILCSSLLRSYGRNIDTLDLQADINILSVFPHDQRPVVIGELLQALAGARSDLSGLASSPSAISSVVPAAATLRGVDAIFGCFEFPTYKTVSDWRADWRSPDRVSREIIASYEEEAIKMYGIVEQGDLDLWILHAASPALGDLGAAIKNLGDVGLRIPFLIGMPSSNQRVLFAFCLPSATAQEVGRALAVHLPNSGISRQGPVVALFIHGPHFGDRYGIAYALARALRKAGVPLVAISCTVSSISAVIRLEDVAMAKEAIESAFLVPTGEYDGSESEPSE